MKKHYLHCVFEGEEIAYQVVMPAVRQYLRMFAENEAGLLEVAIAEAISNAVRASGKHSVHLTMYIHSSHELIVQIRDHGKGFNVDKAMSRVDEMDRDLSEEALFAESGRGLWVIRQVFDEVQFNPPGNKVNLIKNLTI